VKRLVWAALIAFVLVAYSFTEAAYRDISDESPHRQRIGQVCQVKNPMRAHGVTVKVEKDKKTDHVIVWDPGFTGPEVTFIEYIQPGTTLRVLEARKCWNCLDNFIDYRVEVQPLPRQFAGHPVYVRAESMTQQYLQCGSDKIGVQPNPSINPDAAR